MGCVALAVCLLFDDRADTAVRRLWSRLDELGQLAGLTGTPAIVLEDGRMLPGYLSADQLGEVLGI